MFTVEGVKVVNSSYATNRVPGRYRACLPTPGQEVEDGYGPGQGDAQERVIPLVCPTEFPLIR